jgi:hypothetical protein
MEVSFTPRPLHSRVNRPRYTLDTRLGGPHSRSGCCGEEKNVTPAGNRTQAFQFVTIPTPYKSPLNSLYPQEDSDGVILYLSILLGYWLSS